MNQGFVLKEKVAALEAALLDKHPQMPNLLKEIHKALAAQPENVILLTNEERAVIVKGLQTHTNVHFAEAVVKKPSATKSLKARINQLGLDAI